MKHGYIVPENYINYWVEAGAWNLFHNAIGSSIMSFHLIACNGFPGNGCSCMKNMKEEHTCTLSNIVICNFLTRKTAVSTVSYGIVNSITNCTIFSSHLVNDRFLLYSISLTSWSISNKALLTGTIQHNLHDYIQQPLSSKTSIRCDKSPAQTLQVIQLRLTCDWTFTWKVT